MRVARFSLLRGGVGGRGGRDRVYLPDSVSVIRVGRSGGLGRLTPEFGLPGVTKGTSVDVSSDTGLSVSLCTLISTGGHL